MQLAPASLTKIMTIYVIGKELQAGNISLDDEVTISENAWAKKFPDSSKMFIEVGTQVSVRDLLRGIVVQSGNDSLCCYGRTRSRFRICFCQHDECTHGITWHEWFSLG